MPSVICSLGVGRAGVCVVCCVCVARRLTMGHGHCFREKNGSVLRALGQLGQLFRAS